MHVQINIILNWSLVRQSISNNTAKKRTDRSMVGAGATKQQSAGLGAMVYILLCCVWWGLNGLENRQVENKSCSASQFSPGALGCFVLLVLNHCDVAEMTLTSQPRGADRHEGQFTQSGWDRGESRYWKTTS